MKEKTEETVIDYAIPVHKSLMEHHAFFGVGETAFYIIVGITLMLVTMLSLWCVLVGIAALFVCRLLCKDEPMLLDFLFENLFIQGFYRG